MVRLIPLRFRSFTTNVNLKQYIPRLLRIAETVALSTSQSNVQHTAKHVASAGNETILPLHVEALLSTKPNARLVNEVTAGTTSQSDPSVLRVQSLRGRKKRNSVGSKMRSTLRVNGTHTCAFKLRRVPKQIFCRLICTNKCARCSYVLHSMCCAVLEML